MCSREALLELSKYCDQIGDVKHRKVTFWALELYNNILDKNVHFFYAWYYIHSHPLQRCLQSLIVISIGFMCSLFLSGMSYSQNL